VNRRTFLRRGLIGGAVLALGAGGLLALPSGSLAAPSRALAVLSPRSFGVLVAFARRMIRIDDVDHVAVAHRVDDALRYAAPEAQNDVNALLMLFENALPAFLFDGRVTPFSRLSAEDQDRVLDRWRRSSIEVRRNGYAALRKMVAAAQFGDEASWSEIGYPPPIPYPVAYDDSKFGSTV
jgi:hypothetical protein